MHTTAHDPVAQRLIDLGCVSAQMLAYAQAVQVASRKSLSDTLLELRLVTEAELAQAISEAAGLPMLPLDFADLNAAALGEVPYAFAQKFQVLPLRKVDGVLWLATASPDLADLGQRLARFTNLPLRWCVAPRGALARSIESFYHFVQRPIEREIDDLMGMARGTREFDAERLVQLLITAGVQSRASDIHFVPSTLACMVMFRIDGVLQLRHVLPARAHPRVVSVIKVDAGMDIAETRKAQDGRVSFKLLSQSYDLRVSAVPASLGESVVIRILSTDGDVLPLEQLGFSVAQRELIGRMLRQPQGIVLATGPTGSGKTTTLYAALRRLNALERNVMTIEDPVEYVVPLFRQVSVNEKAGYGFASAMRSFLRQDPDVMLVGEVRDAESASMAVRAAQTGHLVPATLHTNSAVSAVVRLRDLGVATFLVSSSLLGVIAQRLLRKLCEHCRTPDPLMAGRYQAVGCPRCAESGYFGRIAVGEVLLMSNPMRTAIEAGAGVHELHDLAVREGMLDLAASALEVVNAGVTDLAEMRRVIGDL